MILPGKPGQPQPLSWPAGDPGGVFWGWGTPCPGRYRPHPSLSQSPFATSLTPPCLAIPGTPPPILRAHAVASPAPRLGRPPAACLWLPAPLMRAMPPTPLPKPPVHALSVALWLPCSPYSVAIPLWATSEGFAWTATVRDLQWPFLRSGGPVARFRRLWQCPEPVPGLRLILAPASLACWLWQPVARKSPQIRTFHSNAPRINIMPMDTYSHPDAPDDQSPEPLKQRKGGGNGWRKSNPTAARAAVYRWRSNHRSHYNDYQKRYQQARRQRLKRQRDDEV